MKQKKGFSKSWLYSTLIPITILLMLFQPLASSIPLAAPLPVVAQSEQPQAMQYYSLWLGGVDAYMGVPYSSELNYLNAITIEAWVYRNTDLVNETLVGNGGNDSYWLGFVSGKLRFIPHGGTAVDSNASIVSGKWTHVSVTYNENQRNFYINGALDKTSIVDPGDITPNPGTELGIGHDSDLYTANYFDGLIDEVHIWNVVRTPAQIQAGMFQSYISPLPSSLLGYWRMNGNSSDETGDHDGTMYGDPGFEYGWANDGGIPKDIRIPQVSNTPSLDGFCNPTEYTNAVAVSVDGIIMNLQHTSTDLWVCFDFSLRDNTRARLLLDPTHDRLDPAHPDDIRLEVRPDDSLYAYAGNDAGGWVITDTYDTLWDGEYYASGGEFPTYSAELRVDSSVVGGWGHLVGLALDPYDPGFGGYDRAGIWPALATSGKPSSWSSATLAGVGPTRYFSGLVLYQPKNPDYDPTGVYGALMELYGYDQGGSEALVAKSTTGHTGSFGLTTNDDFTYHRLELGSIPQGYVYASAEADSNDVGVVLDSRTIDYGDAGGGAYTSIEFILGDNIPINVNAAYGPVFLIVAPQAVIQADALDAFVTFKTQQGYAVSVRSVEEADTYPGVTRLEPVRAIELEYLAQYGSRFQFVMLVGGNDVIPFAKMTPWATGEGAVCPTEDPVNYKFSDWPYVDLTSNWDSNGNGCYGDGALQTADKLVGGYVNDTGIAFDPTIALGRMPFSQPETVRKVLQTSIGFERQSESFKLKALNGMSMTALKGYLYGVACTHDDWGYHCVAPLPNNQSNYDYSLLSEEMKNDFLNVNGFDTTILYENEEEVAGGQGIHSPVDLTLANLRSTLDSGRYGLATMSGHGNTSGVYRNFWIEDKNSNGVVDVRDDSETELSEVTFFDIGGVLDEIDPDGSRGGVFVLLGCSNASPTNASNIAATILADGHGPASVGGLSGIGVGSWFNEGGGNVGTIGYYVGKRLVSNNYRLGESVWWTLADLLYTNLSGSGGVAFDLYGDPTLSFFGNPSGQTTLAAWPMGRRDSTGASYLSLPGPTYPKKLWEYSTDVHLSQTYGPTPLVSANGEVIVASGTHVDILRQGTLYQRLELDAYVFGSPALSADGTLYVMDVEAGLYAFPYRRFTWNNNTVLMHDRLRRWKVDLGENPQASPVVGSDGFILAGIGGPLAEDARLWLVRPDGYKFTSYSLDMNPTYYAATDANRTIYVATYGDQGHLYRFAPFCDTTISPDVCPSPVIVETTMPQPFSTPPLLAGDSLYIGNLDDTLYKYNKDSLTVEASFIASSDIVLGPIVSPNGDIVFVTLDDVMYSVTKDLNTVRWQKYLGYDFPDGIPAASNNAIYMAFNGYLHAYNPSSGAQLWQRNLGEDIGYASVSVGYGREIYMQGSSGKVLAFSEGWGIQPALINAFASAEAGRLLIDLEIFQSIEPINGTLQSEPLAPQADIVAILLQRSEDGGLWEDRAMLPPGTTSYRDTDIEPNTSYAYRAQNLMSDGSNSDFTTTLEVVQSYPDVPVAPTLSPVLVDGAETLSLTWSHAAGSVVDHFVVERGLTDGGPFTAVITLTGETFTTQDTGLSPGITYYYQVRAVNGTGSSNPSNVQSGTTRTQTLPAPQNFQAALEGQTEIRLTWDAGPVGAIAVLEVIAFGEVGYTLLDSVNTPEGAYTFFIGEPGAYNFRIKYVQGDNESAYAYSTASLVIYQTQQIYLPLMER